jgi:glycosyltransferase involved in cell wall biosynthesis
MDTLEKPHVVVLSSLFPSAIQPGAGLFVRERMFRVGRHLPLAVIAPTPWFPLQGLLRKLKPHFRPGAPRHENQSGFDVWYPRFLSVPGFLKQYDGLMMALGAYCRLNEFRKSGRLDLIDAHFAYPDGYAASVLGRWFGVPFTVTLRGTEARLIHDDKIRPRLLSVLRQAARVFSVSESLRTLMVEQGGDPEKIEVIGNGVDAVNFSRRDPACCRKKMGLLPAQPVLVSVGGLVPRKGFHRVIELLPRLRERFSDLVFLIVGGASAEGDIRAELERQLARLKLEKCVRFLGVIPPVDLPDVLSAADVFVLATSNEGWANVFLEAMACGLPVVTTDVGGNREVVCNDKLGRVVPFGDAEALYRAIESSLSHGWDKAYIRHHAKINSWDERVEKLCRHFRQIASREGRNRV